jgi:hypothetical protein
MNTNFVAHFEQYANASRGENNLFHVQAILLDRLNRFNSLKGHRVDMITVCNLAA